jgi:hypothetical protein
MKSVYLLQPLTDRAKEWVEENVDYESTLGDSIGVEWRYILPILAGMKQDGLRIDEDYTVT